MIEINLIPDVKRELLRAQAWRSFIVFVAFLVGAGSIALVVLVLGVMGGQALLIGNNDKAIKEEFNKILAIQDVEKTTTLQNQLSEIEDLRKASPNMSRILNQIVYSVRPEGDNSVDYSSISYDLSSYTMTIEGRTPNQFKAVEALKKTIEDTSILFRDEYREDGATCSESDVEKTEETGCRKESLIAEDNQVEVVEHSFDEDQDGNRVTRFKLNFKINPKALRYSSKNLAVKSPSKKDATDSRMEIPDDIFKAKEEK